MAELSEFVVTTSTGAYGVVIGEGTLTGVVNTADVVIVDEALAARMPLTRVPVLSITADEASKTLASCESLILSMLKAGVRRGDHLVAIGGGAVQDVATFVADIYMRGLPWSYVPTTLMAMTDSCIGGKSSINVGEVKNLVGGIYPPRQVAIDPTFLSSLGPSAMASGFSEAAKIAFCRGPEAFASYLVAYGSFKSDPTRLIKVALDAKRWFVETDEHDRRERRLLNFGHTFGHALESAVDHSLPHGMAVAVGVLCACAHPLADKGFGSGQLARHVRNLLALAPDVMGPALARFNALAYERAFRSDKKHQSSSFHLILPARGGGVAEVTTPADPDGWKIISDVTDHILTSLGVDK